MAMMMIGTNDPREAEMIMVLGSEVRRPCDVVRLQENVSLALDILEDMEEVDMPMRASEIAEDVGVSTQRVTAILRKLTAAGKTVRIDTKQTEIIWLGISDMMTKEVSIIRYALAED